MGGLDAATKLGHGLEDLDAFDLLHLSPYLFYHQVKIQDASAGTQRVPAILSPAARASCDRGLQHDNNRQYASYLESSSMKVSRLANYMTNLSK
jgi:hypothetical protein